MEELGLIRDLCIVWLTALIAGAICIQLRTQTIVGYIAAGVLLGPYGARLIEDVHHIRVLSEMGVALLLFALGVELSLRQIFSSAKQAVLAGIVQIALTICVAGAFSHSVGLTPDWKSSLVFGFMTALSSTALITKLLVDQGEAETSHARLLIAILLLQDLALIPFVAFLPALNSSNGDSNIALIWALAKAALLVVLVIIGATWWIPRLLSGIVKANSRELFILTVISICLSTAMLSHRLGVSLALGAFLAGIMVSEKPYGQQVLSDIMPIRDLFATIFFVAVGLLLNPEFVANNVWLVVAFVALILIGKSAIGWVSARIATDARWTAARTGVGLAQIGEFSFVLATIAHGNGLLSKAAYNLFFAGAVISLLLSPALIAQAPKLFAKFLAAPGMDEAAADSSTKATCRNHVVLCGFGRIGRHIGLSLASYGIPIVVVDVDPEVIDELSTLAIKHVYGDAFSPVVLSKAGAEHASCIVIAIPDAIVVLNAIAYVRRHNPDAKILVRAHHLADVDALNGAGASAIVQPEFEASLELLKLSMVAMHRPQTEIEAAAHDMRRYANLMFQPDLTTPHTV